MKNIMKIGEFSKLNRISIQTLRYYEEIGLLYPYKIDPQTNYRYYHMLQSPVVDSIRFLKQSDFSLTDISLMLSETTPDHSMTDLIEEKHQKLLLEQQKLNIKIAQVESFLENNRVYQESQLQQSFQYVSLPKRYIYTFPIEENIYTMTPIVYENALASFRHHLLENNLHALEFSHIGSITSLTHIQENELYSNKLFVFCSIDLRHLPAVTSLEKKTYAIDYCYSFEEEKNNFHPFLQRIQKENKLPQGDYLCEVIREMSHSTKLQRNMCIRMQLPVI